MCVDHRSFFLLFIIERDWSSSSGKDGQYTIIIGGYTTSIVGFKIGFLHMCYCIFWGVIC